MGILKDTVEAYYGDADHTKENNGFSGRPENDDPPVTTSSLWDLLTGSNKPPVGDA